jgi:hypothetical protein
MLQESNHPLNSDYTNITILKGKNFESTIDMSKLLPDKKDQLFLSTAGVFWLY